MKFAEYEKIHNRKTIATCVFLLIFGVLIFVGIFIGDMLLSIIMSFGLIFTIAIGLTGKKPVIDSEDLGIVEPPDQ